MTVWENLLRPHLRLVGYGTLGRKPWLTASGLLQTSIGSDNMGGTYEIRMINGDEYILTAESECKARMKAINMSKSSVHYCIRMTQEEINEFKEGLYE
jgi:hypothetical protein